MFSKTKIRPFMKNLYDDMPNGYQETINKGMSPGELEDRSICIDGDIGEVFETQIL